MPAGPVVGLNSNVDKVIAVPRIGAHHGAKVGRSVLVTDDIGETIFKRADVDLGDAETDKPPFVAASKRDAD